jgi:hypothetical protein
MRFNINAGKFPLGRVVMTTGAYDALSPLDMKRGLFHHSQGEWGDLPAHDQEANDHAVENGGPILSSYVTDSGTRFCIIPEANRTVTTVFLPDEY